MFLSTDTQDTAHNAIYAVTIVEEIAMRQPVLLLREHAPIQPQAVRAALDTLLYSSSAERHTPLEHLWLVDAYLLDPENPLNIDERQLALHTILIDLITAELACHRTALHLDATSADLFPALDHISADARTENIELIAWSWLYYRYVRVDLHVTPSLFCQYAHCDERTRRRYQTHGIRRLTERLVKQEREARRILWKHRLYAELPMPFPIRLFGRDELLAQARTLFESYAPPLIQVNGEAGIGKTAFVVALIRERIEAGGVSELIWLERPTTCIAVMDAVKQRLPPDIFTMENPFIKARSIVLVLDDLSLLADNLPALNQLLSGLAPITVCLIHYTPLPVSAMSVQIRLDALMLIETHALIRGWEGQWARSLNGLALSDVEIMALWESARGNPAVLLREFHALIGDN